jgi:hypothetical protein
MTSTTLVLIRTGPASAAALLAPVVRDVGARA